VDETRPRNQGAALTCWELAQADIPHSLIVDNAGGHLMQAGLVDLCVVGSDRTTRNGDVCNKIGTYLKALAAFDNQIPFYVALPLSSIDFALEAGVNQIPIEERASGEVTDIPGRTADGLIASVRVAPESVQVSNPGFDVTPARLVTSLVTERGVVAANSEAIASLLD
jgi:methylthioribose-1-phosphate isomerase